MMKTRTMVLALILVAVAIASPVAASDSLQINHSSFAAEKNNQKHPAMTTQAISIIQEMVDPRLCIAYDNSIKKKGGKGRARITITHVDDTQTVVILADQARTNSYVKCTKTGDVIDLVPGDVVVFEVDFTKFPRLRRSDERVDRINIYAIVVANGFPLPLSSVGAIAGPEEEGKEGGWFRATNYDFQAAKNNQKHPETSSKMVVIQRDYTAPNMCFLYRNTANKGGKGKVDATVSTYRGDEMIASLKLKSRVNRNKAKECKVGEDLLAGDVVYWDLAFENLPRLKKGSNKTDNAEVTGVVSGNGEPEFASASDTDSPNPGPDAPPPSGGLSSADLSAAAKLLVANKKVQLWRFKADNPTKWTVVGPKTQLGDGRGSLNEATAGYGNTIAAAVADYERKMGKLASGGSLTSADVNGLVWYSGINSSQGPTSIRRSATGGYFGEYYRPGRGAQHEGPFGSLSKAIQWLQAQGL